jgi:hypothetical protein
MAYLCNLALNSTLIGYFSYLEEKVFHIYLGEDHCGSKMGSFLMYSPCSVPSGFAEIVKNKEGQ